MAWCLSLRVLAIRPRCFHRLRHRAHLPASLRGGTTFFCTKPIKNCCARRETVAFPLNAEFGMKNNDRSALRYWKRCSIPCLSSSHVEVPTDFCSRFYTIYFSQQRVALGFGLFRSPEAVALLDRTNNQPDINLVRDRPVTTFWRATKGGSRGSVCATLRGSIESDTSGEFS